MEFLVDDLSLMLFVGKPTFDDDVGWFGRIRWISFDDHTTTFIDTRRRKAFVDDLQFERVDTNSERERERKRPGVQWHSSVVLEVVRE